jgi:hypothetical protein
MPRLPSIFFQKQADNTTNYSPQPLSLRRLKNHRYEKTLVHLRQHPTLHCRHDHRLLLFEL